MYQKFCSSESYIYVYVSIFCLKPKLNYLSYSRKLFSADSPINKIRPCFELGVYNNDQMHNDTHYIFKSNDAVEHLPGYNQSFE